LNPIRIIAGKEFKTAFKDKIFIVITVLFLVLSIVSVYIGSSTKNAEMKAYQDIVGILKSQGNTNLPVSPDIYPLSILRNIITYVSMVGAVLAIFLGFDAFSGERENGTIKLLLTKPLYRDQIVTGKLLGAACVIGSLLGITLIVNIVLFGAVSGLIPDIGEISRLAAFMIIAFLYMMSFYIAALFVSIKTTNRAFGFMAMMIVWIFISFVIPQLADTQRNFAYAMNATAQTVTQIPSDTTISKAVELFSPAVQFTNIGKNLLQVIPETADMNLSSLLLRQILPLIYMMAPGAVLLMASYRAVQKEDAI